VDGNDVFALYKAAKYSIEKARAGGGPTLIEMFTYRLSDHTTADDAARYRTAQELEAWEKKDPVDRFRKFLFKKNWLTQQGDQEILKHAHETVDAAVKEAESIGPPKPEDMFTNMYAQLSKILKEEMGEAKLASS